MVTGQCKAIFLACIFLFFACETDLNDSVNDFASGVPELHLAVVDSFGVEIGDSLNTIGSINGYFVSSEGAIVLLDGVAKKIRIFQRSGEVSCFGRVGGGPGEMSSPKSICLMPDGRILVPDDQKCIVMEYDISGNYLGNYLESGWKIPEDFFPIDSNSVVGVVFEPVYGEGEIEGFNFYIGRFDADPEPAVRYIEVYRDLHDPSLYTHIDILDYCIDSNGLAYIVPDHTDYLINVLNSDGVLLQQICPEITRLEKTDEEIAIELAVFEEDHLWDRGYSGGYEPLQYYKLISLVGIDKDRNLWVQRMDAENGFIFDVWDLSGSLIHTVALDEFTSNPDIEFYVDANGILGVIADSDVYPRVYRLEMIEQIN